MRKRLSKSKKRLYKATKLVLSALTESPFWYRRTMKDRLILVKEHLAYFI